MNKAFFIGLMILYSICATSCKKDPSYENSTPNGCINHNWVSHFWLDQFPHNSKTDTFVMVYHDSVSGKFDTSIVYNFAYFVDSTKKISEVTDYLSFIYRYESITTNTWGGLSIRPLIIIGTVNKKNCLHGISGSFPHGGVFGGSYNPADSNWVDYFEFTPETDRVYINGTIHNDVYKFPGSGAYEHLYFVEDKGLAKKEIKNEGIFDLVKIYKK